MLLNRLISCFSGLGVILTTHMWLKKRSYWFRILPDYNKKLYEEEYKYESKFNWEKKCNSYIYTSEVFNSIWRKPIDLSPKWVSLYAQKVVNKQYLKDWEA